MSEYESSIRASIKMGASYHGFTLTGLQPNFRTVGGADKCRETISFFVNTISTKEAKLLLGFISQHSMHKFITYINKIEKSFGFKGDLTRLIESTNIRKHTHVYLRKRNKGKVLSNIISLNEEWLVSPTLYQTALLIVRVFVMDSAKDKKVYSGIKSFRKFNPFGVLNSVNLPKQLGEYIQHIDTLHKLGYELLKNRYTLFDSSNQVGEWTSDQVTTNYGKCTITYMPSSSGTTALGNYLRYGSINYFKQISKKDILEDVFGNCMKEVV